MRTLKHNVIPPRRRLALGEVEDFPLQGMLSATDLVVELGRFALTHCERSHIERALDRARTCYGIFLLTALRKDLTEEAVFALQLTSVRVET